MRRLIAYISLAVSLIIATALTIIAPIKGLNSNLEYSNGREFVYKISPKANDEGIVVDEFLPDDAIDEIFDVMDQRMETFGVSEYQLAKEGSDIIRATASLDGDQYDRLRVYLNYNANFTIRIAKDDETTAIADAEQMFDGVKARIEYRGPYPFIIIPLSDPVWFQDNIVSVAEKIQQEEQAPTEDGSQPEIVDNAKIVLWSDFNPDTDSYEKSREDNEVAGKLFLSFDYRSMFWNEDKTEIAVASPIEGYNEQNSYTTQQIMEATETARFMVNVFNAGTLNYDVEFLFQNQIVNPTVEPLLVFGQSDRVALSRTVVALALAFIFIFIVIGLIYRLPVFAVVSSFMVTMLGTLLLFNAIAVEISTSAIIGFIFTGLLAVFGSVTYLSKFRNEVYRGRSFKKAHAEASRRSSVYNLDALIVSLIIGVVVYFTAGPAVIGFGTVLIFGSIVGLVSILFHNSIVYWLLANNTSTQKNYKIYGVDEHKVANLLENEKPSYFGRFAATNPKTKAKLYTSIFATVFVAGVATLSVFASLGRNPLSLQVQDENLTRVYFRVSENSSVAPSSQTLSPDLILGSITFENEPLELVKVDDLVSYETHSYSTKEGEGENVIVTEYTYLVYEVLGEFNGEEVVDYNFATLALSGSAPLIDALTEMVEQADPNATVSVNHVQKQAVSPSVVSVVIVSLITVGFTSLYIAIRFGLAKGISNLFVTSSVSLGVLLFFIATRITVHPLTALGALVAVLTVALINVIIHNYQKDLRRDSFFRDLNREEKERLGLTMSLTPLYVIYILSAVAFIFFMAIAPYVVSMVYVSVLLAVLIALLATTRLNLSLNQVIQGFVTKLGALKLKLPKSKRALHRENARRNVRGRTNEPEEAVIIGIND